MPPCAMYEIPGSVLGGFGWPVNAAANQAQAFLSPQNGAFDSSGMIEQVNPLEPGRTSMVIFFAASIRTIAAFAEIAAGAPPWAAWMDCGAVIIAAWAGTSAGSSSAGTSPVQHAGSRRLLPPREGLGTA